MNVSFLLLSIHLGNTMRYNLLFNDTRAVRGISPSLFSFLLLLLLLVRLVLFIRLVLVLLVLLRAF